MRSRAAQLACLLLLLSSLAVSDVRADSVTSARTPGGVFVRNLVLQASVDDVDIAVPAFAASGVAEPGEAVVPTKTGTRPRAAAAVQAARVHAVTGSSL